MNSQRKITAILFALLAAYITVCIPVMPGKEWQEIPVENGASLLVMQQVQNIYIPERFEAPQTSEGWKTEIRTPGLFFRKMSGLNVPPPHPGFRNIFVFHPETFTSSKSVFLYPFHDFL